MISVAGREGLFQPRDLRSAYDPAAKAEWTAAIFGARSSPMGAGEEFGLPRAHQR